MFVYDYIHKKETGGGAEPVETTIHDLYVKTGDPASLPVFANTEPTTSLLLEDLYNTYNYIYNISYWDAEANKTVTKVYAEKIEVGKPFVPSRTATGEIDTTKATEIEWVCDGIRIVPNPIEATYTITFKNGEETLATTEVLEGETPEYSGDTPTQEATAEFTYTFDHWEPTIVAATTEATYTAAFSSITNKYLITWENEDGTALASEEVEYGETPSYSGETPTKADDDTFTYTFAETWTPEVVAVTTEAVYTAVFNSEALPNNGDPDVNE